MTSVYFNFNFLCGRPHGAGPPPPVHMHPPEPDPLPPPCGRHKWTALLPKTGSTHLMCTNLSLHTLSHADITQLFTSKAVIQNTEYTLKLVRIISMFCMYTHYRSTIHILYNTTS